MKIILLCTASFLLSSCGAKFNEFSTLKGATAFKQSQIKMGHNVSDISPYQYRQRNTATHKDDTLYVVKYWLPEQ